MKRGWIYIFVFAVIIASIVFVSSVNLDLNHDGVVNITDLQLIASHYEGKAAYNSSYDFNNDSKVDLYDIVAVARQINNNSNSSGNVSVNTSADGLLYGYTVNSTNGISGPVPSGWTLVDAQGFESGSYNTGNGEKSYGDNAAGITNTTAHTGTHSQNNYITSSFRGYGMQLSGNTINARDIDVSYWRYVTNSNPGYGYDDTNWFVDVRSPPNYSTPGYGIEIDQAPPGSCCLTLTANAVAYGSIPTGNPAPWGGGGSGWTYTPGKWQQIEVRIKANDPNQTNGELQEYVDGVRVLDCSAATNCPYNQWCTGSNCPIPGDFVGPVDYSKGDLYIGGDWGKDVWYSDAAHTICSTSGDMGMGPVNVNMANPQCPNQAPPNGVVPYFHIYIDDVIVIKK